MSLHSPLESSSLFYHDTQSSPLVHEASLVPHSWHSPALLDLIELQFTEPVVDYVVSRTREVVAWATTNLHTKSIRVQTSKSMRQLPTEPGLADFIVAIAYRCRVTMSSVLGALVYLERVKHHLRIARDDFPCHRIFLAAIMVSSKYLNDSNLKNGDWSRCSGLFLPEDILKMELEFLAVLDYRVGISESDLMIHHQPLVPSLSSSFTRCVLPRARTCPRLSSTSPPLSAQFPLPPQRRTSVEFVKVPRSNSSSSLESEGSTMLDTPLTPQELEGVPLMAHDGSRKGDIELSPTEELSYLESPVMQGVVCSAEYHRLHHKSDRPRTGVSRLGLSCLRPREKRV